MGIAVHVIVYATIVYATGSVTQTSDGTQIAGGIVDGRRAFHRLSTAEFSTNSTADFVVSSQ
jgi:hypothetical protein